MIISTVIGGVGMLALLLCYQFSDYKKVLITKFSADCLWAIHYALIGGYSAMITNIICAVREIIYLFDKNAKRHAVWLIAFLIIGWILSYFRWTGPISIFPTLAFTIGAYSFWQKNIRITRIMALVNACLMFTYDIFVASYIGMLNESLTFVTVVVTVIKNELGRVKFFL